MIVCPGRWWATTEVASGQCVRRTELAGEKRRRSRLIRSDGGRQSVNRRTATARPHDTKSSLRRLELEKDAAVRGKLAGRDPAHIPLAPPDLAVWCVWTCVLCVCVCALGRGRVLG